MKKKIQIELCDLGSYVCTDFSLLEEIKEKNKSLYSNFKLETIDNDCGCYHDCSCRKYKVVFFGERLETLEEYNKRLSKEKDRLNKQKSEQEKQEKELLKRLQQKYSQDPDNVS